MPRAARRHHHLLVEQPGEQLREVTNIEEAMTYIDKAVAEKTPISEILIRELHAITVEQLTEEGDRTPGAYREGSVVIAASEHLPPDAVQVSAYMEELKDDAKIKYMEN